MARNDKLTEILHLIAPILEENIGNKITMAMANGLLYHIEVKLLPIFNNVQKDLCNDN